MGHTKGPWHVSYHPAGEMDVSIKDADGNIVCMTHIERRASVEWKPLRGKECEGNARLIAAAPELLEACMYVVGWHREHDSGAGELFRQDFVTTCIAAIRKAKGE